MNEIKQLKEENSRLLTELNKLKKEQKTIDTYYKLFDTIDLSLSEFDVEELRKENKRLKDNNIQIDEYFEDNNNLKKHASLLKLKRINKGTVKLFEAENEEDLRKNFLKISTIKSLQGIKERQIAFFNGDSYYESENTYLTLKGREIQVIEKIYFLTEPYNIAIISLQDITENIYLEKELKSNRENYRFLFENSPVMIIEYDLSEVYKYYLSLNLKSLEDFKRLLTDKSTGTLEEAFKNLKIKDVNSTTVNILKAPNKKDIIEHFDHYYTKNTFNAYLENVVLVFEGLQRRQFETELKTSEDKLIDVLITWQVVPGYEKNFSKKAERI